MKIRTVFVIVFLLITTISRADYFERLPYSISQPDGEKINCYVSGDEFFNWIHDQNGYTIIQAPNGYYYYAKKESEKIVPSAFLVNKVDPASVGLSPWIKISKAEYKQKRDAIFSFEKAEGNVSTKAPHSGVMNNIVVYIRFSDDAELTTTRQVYDDKFNPSTGVALKSYFQEVSYNNFTIISTHYPACALTTNLSYQDSHARAYFQPYNATTNPTGYNGDTERTTREHQLLVSAITWINANSPVSASLNIDADNDNRVDNVCFIIKGSNGGWSELLWAHRWALYSQTVYINGKRVYDYTFQPESQVAVKTLCHEMFHALGSPDLYHYDDGGLNIDPVGYWDLMESGGGHMLAYMKWKYSGYTWISSIPQITANGTYTLNPLTSSTNNCFKIASPYSTYEYFMVEYRNKSGTFETNIPASGLIVYRIDTREEGNASGPPDEVYVYRPGGSATVNGSPDNANFSSTVGRTAINDATNPSSFLQNGSLGGLNISNVTAAGATISFTVTFPTPCTPPTAQATSFTSSAITSTSLTAGWTRGSGTGGVIVIAKAGSVVDAGPVNGTTYTANAAFGNGTQLGTGNYVVYKGSGTSVNITGLTEGTPYYFAVYEYNTTNYCYTTTSLTGSATTPGYCTAGSPATAYEYISNVAIGTVNQASSRGTNGYQNFTAQTISMQTGVNISATVSVTNPYSTDQVLIWIDWNKDNDFLDIGENVYTSSGLSFTSPHVTSAFSPPAGAATGVTRMRIRMHDSGSGPNANPCGDASWGEVEDYSVNVLSCDPPVIGAITQPTCTLATGSVALSGLPASGNWTLTRYPGGNTTNGSGTATTITGLTVGIYTYTVTTALGCTSAQSGNVVINSQPATPAAPVPGTINQPTCTTATGGVALSSLPASGNWTLTRYPGAITANGSGTTTTILGLAAGTYTYTVTNAAGCTSVGSSNVVINAQPVQSPPAVGTITQPTCTTATGGVALSSLPASGNWTLTRYPGAITANGSGTTTTILGLAAGTYTYTVTNAAGCTSVGSSNVVINAQPVQSPPAVGTITQPTCTIATGSVALSGLPTSGNWTLTRYPGAITANGSGTTTTINGLAAGTYTYIVTNALGCTSAVSANVVINNQPTIPVAGIISGSTEVCQGQDALIYRVSGISDASSYVWTLPANASGSSTTDSIIVNFGPAAQSGNITVKGYNSCGEGAASILPITVSTPKTMQLTLFLEGLYTGNGLMRQAQGASGPQFGAGIADRVALRFHNATSPYSLAYEVSNIDLLTNGLLSISNLPCNISGYYYIVIQHRNSIETWSSLPLDFTGAGPFSYDFSTAASQAYGNNQKLMGGVYVIWGGDPNQDGIVDGSDMSVIDNGSQPPILHGYYPEDVNGDGIVDGSDMSMVDNNSAPPPVHVVRP